MQIQVNGEEREVREGIRVSELLSELGLQGLLVAVERNEEIIPRAEHGSAALGAGDQLEIVQFVGGG